MPLSRVVGPVLAGLFFLVSFWLSPPAAFPSPEALEVPYGTTLTSLARELKQKETVRSAVLFRLVSQAVGGERGIIAGRYFLERPLSVLGLAWRLNRGRFGISLIKVTIPEGLTVAEIADLLTLNLPDFNRDAFIGRAAASEGHLFPDTYFVPPDISAEAAAEHLRVNFERQIGAFQPQMAAAGLALRDVVIMASLVEKEAAEFESRRIIAGILWKRLENDWPLQVDAVFSYLLGKSSRELTKEDLQLDSPYNTYRYRGLPAGPINNPGRESILAVLSPLPTPYWFYLSDLSGRLHYAIDFDEHRRNRERYLNLL